jgi:hypothetical protein
MYEPIIDEASPRYRGPHPRPRGLLPVPPEIALEVSRDQALVPVPRFIALPRRSP